MRLFRTSPAIRPRRRTARRSARSAVALALVASLLSPVPAASQQDGNVPDPQPDAQLITDVWGYAAETEKGYDHVLGWMRVLKALGALTSMTAAEAQGYADRGSVDTEDDELRTARNTAQSTTLPTACGADFATTVDWFESVTATATLISITLKSPLPVNSASNDAEVCGPHGPADSEGNPTYVVRRHTDLFQVAAGGKIGLNLWSRLTDDEEVTRHANFLKPDTDYWIRYKADEAGKGSAWTHVRTLAGSPTPPVGCGDADMDGTAERASGGTRR